MIDNVEGMNIVAAGETTSEKYVKTYHVHIYGQTEGDDDRCVSRMGMQLSSLLI